VWLITQINVSINVLKFLYVSICMCYFKLHIKSYFKMTFTFLWHINICRYMCVFPQLISTSNTYVTRSFSRFKILQLNLCVLPLLG
ncbi:mCG144965, partial [Mus musculus]